MIRSERAEADKTEKTKGRPLKGSMVLSNPIVRVPGQRETVVVPLVVVRDRRLGGILATSGEMRREGEKGRDPGGTSEGGVVVHPWSRRGLRRRASAMASKWLPTSCIYGSTEAPDKQNQTPYHMCPTKKMRCPRRSRNSETNKATVQTYSLTQPKAESAQPKSRRRGSRSQSSCAGSRPDGIDEEEIGILGGWEHQECCKCWGLAG
jgi:hypothetical protein